MNENAHKEPQDRINRNVIKEILLDGDDDWFDLAEVIWFVVGANGLDWIADENEIMGKTLDVLLNVLEKGYVRAGYLAGCEFVLELQAANDPLVCPLETVKNRGINHLVLWRLSPSETVAKIRREWIELGHSPELSDICWFEITEEGEKELARILAEDGAQ